VRDENDRVISASKAERDSVRVNRLRGVATLTIGDRSAAAEYLNEALKRARALNLVEEELPTLTGLAELRRQEGKRGVARELLDDVWTPAERGPYPMLHADAYNVLARIERDEGNREAAVAAATSAFSLAWCDGPPYAYDYGLANARKLLGELTASEPSLAAFNVEKFPKIPRVDTKIKTA